VQLFHEDGTQAGMLKLPDGAQVVGAAGSRIFLLSHGSLVTLHTDGSTEQLEALPQDSQSILISPDGQRWIWAVSSPINDGYRSAIYIGEKGAAARPIQTLTNSATWLLPVSWTPQGIFTQHMGGIDGYFVFGLPVLSAVERIDPNTGSVSAVNGSTDAYKVQSNNACAFADEAQDGTVACFLVGQNPVLRLIGPSGPRISIPLATPRFTYHGDAYFSPDGKWLTVCGAVGVGFGMGNPNPQPEQFGADLVTVADGSIVRLKPDGVRLAMGWRSWLPDGKLVLWRPSGAAGGAPGLFLVDPNTQDQSPIVIPTSGRPLGYLS
jgi:hypothetical protein